MGSTRCTNLTVPLIFILIVIAINFTEAAPSSSGAELGRKLLQTENISDIVQTLDGNTVRVDPLKDLKKYRGGYDITNKHYWSSTIFTGLNGYALGVLWLLCGVLYGVFLATTTFCCKNNRKIKLRKRSACYKHCYLWPVLLATFFTILAITACGLVLGGNAKFHSSAKTVVNIIIDTANDATKTIYNATTTMKEMRDELEATSQGDQASGYLNSTSEKLDSQAADIERQTKKNRRLIDKGLKIVYIITSLVISLNVVAVIALSASGFLRLRRALHVLIALCWLLAVLCCLFFGLYFFLGNFIGDTCTALEDFQRDPYNNSLSSILPCDELLSAKSYLSDVSKGIYGLVNEVNLNISHLQQQPYRICNPFTGPPEYAYKQDNCTQYEIPIGEIPAVLKEITCSNADGTCKSGEFISADESRTIEAYSISIQKLLNVYPKLESLVECETVEDAFLDILHKECKPMKKHVEMVWAALVFLAMIMIVLVLVWTIKARHEHNHHFTDGSVKPDSAVANMLEIGTVKAVEDSNTN